MSTAYSVSVRNIFSSKASRIIRILLTNPRNEWSILNLSQVAETGYGHTYRLVESLFKLGLCRRTYANRVTVTNPGELLSRWAAYYDFSLLNQVKSYYSMERELDSFVKEMSSWTDKNLKYALTLHIGASLVAPYVRPASLHIYFEEREEELVKLLDLQPTELGGNVFLVKPYDRGVFYGMQELRRVNIVSNVQLYVDLYNYPARGREAAEHLRRELIGF